MTTIHEQKKNLHAIMQKVVLESFDNGDGEVQRGIVLGLLSLLSRHMTLKETRDWHRGWVMMTAIRDSYRKEGRESGVKAVRVGVLPGESD